VSKEACWLAIFKKQVYKGLGISYGEILAKILISLRLTTLIQGRTALRLPLDGAYGAPGCHNLARSVPSSQLATEYGPCQGKTAEAVIPFNLRNPEQSSLDPPGTGKRSQSESSLGAW